MHVLFVGYAINLCLKYLMTGYRYGKDIIPFGKEDEVQMKYTTDGKALDMLGFTQQENVPPHLHMDDQAHYLLSDDKVRYLC